MSIKQSTLHKSGGEDLGEGQATRHRLDLKLTDHAEGLLAAAHSDGEEGKWALRFIDVCRCLLVEVASTRHGRVVQRNTPKQAMDHMGRLHVLQFDWEMHSNHQPRHSAAQPITLEIGPSGLVLVTFDGDEIEENKP